MSETSPESPRRFPFTRFAFLTTYAIIGIVIVTGIAFGLPMGTGSENPGFLYFGRFHPLVVHLPISLVLLAVVFEALAVCRPFRHLRASVLMILLLASASAGLAVAHGTFLASGGGDFNETLRQHLWSGTALAVLVFLLLPLRVLAMACGKWLWSIAYTTALTLAVGLLVFASHLGGNLTHGADYLVKYMPAETRQSLATWPKPLRDFIGLDSKPAVAANDPTLFDALIAPAFEARCNSCHGATKAKGGLRMHTLAQLMQGGESGPAITLGNLKESEAYARVVLPVDDVDYMPPDGKPSLTKEQVETLKWWIESGLPGETPASTIANPPASVKAQLDAFLATRAKAATTAAEAAKPAPDPAAEFAALEKSLAAINQDWSGRMMPVSRQIADGIALSTAGAGASFDDTALAKIHPIAGQLRDVDLSRTGVTNTGLAPLAAATGLRKLRLDHTRTSAAGLAQLAPLTKLESLNLYGCQDITDDAVEPIAAMKSLRKLFLGETKMSPAAIDRLRASLPDCTILASSPTP